MKEQRWQYLQISDALDREFVSALSQSVPVVGWEPVMSYLALVRAGETEEVEELVSNPPLLVRKFPLQKGYWRPPFCWLSRTGSQVVARLNRQTDHPTETPLICSTPYYAPVAELWPGPVIYYLTDLISAYAGTDPKIVRALDRRLCKVARVVCPNSQRLADYLIADAGCAPSKIQIVPNATRASNVSETPLLEPSALPNDSADLPRPVAGVIGNMAGNLNWSLLRTMIHGTPEFSWLMVGPTNMEVADDLEREARESVLTMGGRVRFVGRKPYGELASYARSFDVAVLPYMKREPTFSGSSTRFYEHLAACRPIVSTKGFEELLHKEPLLKLIDDGEQGIQTLNDLRDRQFDDGQVEARWLASQHGTWETRAGTVRAALKRSRASRGPRAW